jgi:hypothetical protein
MVHELEAALEHDIHASLDDRRRPRKRVVKLHAISDKIGYPERGATTAR